MEVKKDYKLYEKNIQKLEEEIEKGWNGPDSNETIINTVASKQISTNQKN